MIHPEACWRIHITCPRCGAPVVPVALGVDRALQLDTRAVVRCGPCGEEWIVAVTITSVQQAQAGDRSISMAITSSARRIERARRRESA